jgi:hypothetical protein
LLTFWRGGHEALAGGSYSEPEKNNIINYYSPSQNHPEPGFKPQQQLSSPSSPDKSLLRRFSYPSSTLLNTDRSPFTFRHQMTFWNQSGKILWQHDVTGNKYLKLSILNWITTTNFQKPPKIYCLLWISLKLNLPVLVFAILVLITVIDLWLWWRHPVLLCTFFDFHDIFQLRNQFKNFVGRITLSVSWKKFKFGHSPKTVTTFSIYNLNVSFTLLKLLISVLIQCFLQTKKRFLRITLFNTGLQLNIFFFWVNIINRE